LVMVERSIKSNSINFIPVFLLVAEASREETVFPEYVVCRVRGVAQRSPKYSLSSDHEPASNYYMSEW
jgi:hypothetical protein